MKYVQKEKPQAINNKKYKVLCYNYEVILRFIKIDSKVLIKALALICVFELSQYVLEIRFSNLYYLPLAVQLVPRVYIYIEVTVMDVLRIILNSMIYIA